jgi:hypothetical protein
LTTRHSFTGYAVVSTWGHTERGTLTLTRHNDGRWSDGGNDVPFQESDELPAEDWVRPPASVYDRGIKRDIRGVAALREDGVLGAFVLDPASVEWLRRHDPDAIDWLSSDGDRQC